MLTNEQCIEVAEKVWGWECKPREDHGWYTFSGIDKFNYEYTYHIDWLIGQINSWKGFGRTVERAKRIIDGIFWAKFTTLYDNFITGRLPKEEFWAQSHLATLEALNEEGS